jgi:hypothetical protein
MFVLTISFLILLIGCTDNTADVSVKPNSMDSSNRLVVRIKSPEPVSSVVTVEPSIYQPVHFNVLNSGNTSLEGVSPRLPCACQIKQPLPDVLEAGAEAPVIITMLTPFAGLQNHSIEFTDSAGKPFGKVNFTFKVLGEVPRFKRPLQRLEFVHIAGEESKRFVEVRTIESLSKPAWITNATSSNVDYLQVIRTEMSDHVSSDREFTERVYRIYVDLVSDDLGKKYVDVQLESRGSSAFIGILPIEVDCKPRALLIPENIVFDTFQDGQNVTRDIQLISRVGRDYYEITTYDSSLFSIIQKEPHLWEVGINKKPPENINTLIQFVSNREDIVNLPVKVIVSPE